MVQVTEALVDTLNSGVSDAFRTQKQIELDSRRLQVVLLLPTRPPLRGCSGDTDPGEGNRAFRICACR
jgi:hypothetical protein